MNGGRALLAMTLVTALLAVTACGRKAGLDTPYQAAIDARKAAQDAGQPVPEEPEPPVEDKPFVLDPLL